MNTEVYDHIETVLLTEKATLLSEKLNKYVFRVRPSANKLQIKRAIEVIFKKKVADSGLLQDLRERECYVKPTTRRKQAKSAARRRWQKKLQSEQLPKKLY